MSKVRERPADLEPRSNRTEVETRKEVERPRIRPTPVPPPEVSKYVRWLAWMVGVFVVLGTVALIWWGFGVEGDELVAPSIENIDPRESPEILRTLVPELTAPAIETDILRTTEAVGDHLFPGLIAPAIESIDPRESPEILRTLVPGLTAPGIENIDPRESPEILRTLVPGLTAPAIESDILRTTEAVGDHLFPTIVPGLTAPGIENIDPHESPEILRMR